MKQNSIYKIPLAERLSLIVERTLDQFLKIPAFQRYVNRRSNEKYGFKLVETRENASIDDVFKDYKFYDIQKDDIVMDIGAHIGGFSLFVSGFVKQVYAIEPINNEILAKNIYLNRKENIQILPEALGKGNMLITWGDIKKEIPCISLSELISLCGGKVDFLKCDCEGGEWCIRPEELKGIRRIEAEVHNFDGLHNLEDFLTMLTKAGFKYEYTSPREGILILHARNKFI